MSPSHCVVRRPRPARPPCMFVRRPSRPPCMCVSAATTWFLETDASSSRSLLVVAFASEDETMFLGAIDLGMVENR
jgi:hypothetical protein